MGGPLRNLVLLVLEEKLSRYDFISFFLWNLFTNFILFNEFNL